MRKQFRQSRKNVVCTVTALLCAVLLLCSCEAESNPTPSTEVTVTPVQSVNVPVLMYHHLDDKGNGGTVISVENFELQIRAMAEAGYTAVTVQEMIDFVHRDGELPEKPMCITFDDGYESNFALAAPILEKYGMKATVFCIGSSFGRDTYKDSGKPIIPHFSAQEAADMQSRGIFSIQSHSWDMHQSEKYESGTARSCIRPLNGETDEEFATALKSDCEKQRRYFEENGLTAPEALAYPLGVHSELSETVLHDCGILATFTIDPDGANTLERSRSESLFLLHRLNMTDGVSEDELLEYLNTYGQS